jgi:putative PIN family toxin of toxin-antitoxin system
MLDLNNPQLKPFNLVIDTNIVLDLWVYQNPQTHLLKEALDSKKIILLLTQAMLIELDFVLQRTPMLAVLAKLNRTVEELKKNLHNCAQMCEVPDLAPWRCKDKSDQMFIDLAWAHQTHLLSKDKAVLSLNKKFKSRGIFISPHILDLGARISE